jgi:tripartite-type tricarboxylate transporter receptor subunit TctC
MLRYATYCAVLGAVLVAFGLGPASAQNTSYPTRAITIIVPFPAGGTADMLPRIVAEKLRVTFGQPVVIENKPGASGNLGAELVFRAAPDGYTLLNAPQLSYSINHLLNPNLNFDPRGFEPVSVLATYPTVLFARADLPANNLAGLIAFARANPGKLTYASQGKGQIAHLTMEALKLMAKVDILHVPYRGSAPALTDLLGGQVQVMFDLTASSIEHIKAGRLRALGVTTAARLEVLPDVPTVGNFVPGYEAVALNGIGVPRNTPAEIVNRLNKEINAALADPAMKARFADLATTPLPASPAEFGKLIADETDKWGKVIKFANIKPE